MIVHGHELGHGLEHENSKLYSTDVTCMHQQRCAGKDFLAMMIGFSLYSKGR